jgi:hypothetical protein
LLAADSTAKLNKQLQKPPLKGKIITVEKISTIKRTFNIAFFAVRFLVAMRSPLGYK